MANNHFKVSAAEKSAQARALVLGVLKEHGITHPILSSQLTQQTGVSGVGIRAIVSEARREGTPIGSDDTGYFWAHNAGELESTLTHILGRRNALNEVIRGLQSAQSTILQPDEIDVTEIFSGEE